MKPIIEVTKDVAGSIVLVTADKWLMEDLVESAAIEAPAALTGLILARADFDPADADSVLQLTQARSQVTSALDGKSIVLARLLPFEILGLIRDLQACLEKSA